jgi:hypothetical protein
VIEQQSKWLEPILHGVLTHMRTIKQMKDGKILLRKECKGIEIIFI